MPRWILLAAGTLYLAGAAFLFATHGNVFVLVYLFVGGIVLVGSVLAERARYRPRVDRTRGRWVLTGERFIDPSTGREVDVLYNPETGQRDYVDAD